MVILELQFIILDFNIFIFNYSSISNFNIKSLFNSVLSNYISLILIKVARINSECDRFKQIAISARVYGYHACSRDELDSFLLFVANSKLRVRFSFEIIS